jgi:hypothetical protein
MSEGQVLRLSVLDLRQEIEAVSKLASGFLSTAGQRRLGQSQHELAIAVGQPQRDFTWQISREEPIWTRPSRLEYERKPGGTPTKGSGILGALSFRWDLCTGPKPVKDVFLTGNATCMLRLHDSESDVDAALSMWRMEVGAHDSPGSCFHTQVLGTKPVPPFPKSLPVPRLPIFPPTPMACLEFLLSELFQLRWSEEVQRGTQPANMWRGIQQRRLCSFLRWQLKAVEQSTGSPLVELKLFPPADVLAA